MRAEPLSRDDAKVELNKCIEGGRLIFTNHFDQELIADALTVDEVLAACKSGVIVDPPEIDIRHGNWKYRIVGRNLDSESLTVVFTFIPARKAILITVFRSS